MKEMLTPAYWLPLAWVLLQSYLFLSMGFFVTRWKKMLVSPMAGMEYGHVLIAGSMLVGILFISTADIGALFQSAKTLHYNGENWLHSTLLKYTEFFLAGILITGLYVFTAILNQKLFFNSTNASAAAEGDLASGILLAGLNIGTAIVCWFLLNQLAIDISPAFINIR